GSHPARLVPAGACLFLSGRSRLRTFDSGWCSDVSSSVREAPMALTGRRLTLEEFLEQPEAEPALEYADGVVTQKVSPKMYHGRPKGRADEFIPDTGKPRQPATA